MDSLPAIIFLTVCVFFVLVGIHEWGHFYFAKRAGILVREFAIGFGPKLFSFRRGETTFTFRLLPIGGFVQMAGEEFDSDEINIGQRVWLSLDHSTVTHIHTIQPATDTACPTGLIASVDFCDSLRLTLELNNGERATYSISENAAIVKKNKLIQIAPRNRRFSSKTVGQRALAIFAGPMMNFILAYLLFVILVFVLGQPENVKIAQIEKNSPAAAAGLQADDIIIQINGIPIQNDRNLLATEVDDSLNKQMTWIVERNGVQKQLYLTPALMDGDPRVGIRIGADTRPATFTEAIQGAWSYSVNTTTLIFDGFKRLILGQFAWEDLGGPVRTVSVTVEAAKAGAPQLIYWAAILSLYLGIFNLLPFPALDGSRLLFLGLESLRGKPIEPRRESMVHFIGFAMLMCLMVVVTYHDVIRFFK